MEYIVLALALSACFVMGLHIYKTKKRKQIVQLAADKGQRMAEMFISMGIPLNGLLKHLESQLDDHEYICDYVHDLTAINTIKEHMNQYDQQPPEK